MTGRPRKLTIGRMEGVTLDDPHSLGRSQATIRLALILQGAAAELWEVATLDDAAEMWDQVRAISSRLLAACEREG